MKELELLESKELRESMMTRVDVLEKVKGLLLIKGTELATTKQVADFYEVGLEAIKAIIFNHEDELKEDGIKKYSGIETKKFLVSCDLQPTNWKGYFEADGQNFANRSNTLFPKRAILRVGMLLRDSSVAREIRTQLLNVEEHSTDKQRTAELDEEQRLQLEMGMAIATGSIETISFAVGKMFAYKNRYIEKVENDNKALAQGILEWEDRNKLNFALRKYCKITKSNYAKTYNELYKELKNKSGIDLRARKGSPIISTVKENEWNTVIKTFCAICTDNGVSPTDLFKDLESEEN